KKDKETSREQEYNHAFFKTILGYKEKPASPFSFEPKATTDKGQLPDAVISYTDVTNDIRNIAAVVELKGAAVDLDRPQRREGNMSPVQQGFKYKVQYPSVPFVVVSNFWEFRLYHDNLLDYEVWTLDDLVNPSDDYLLFKTWYALLRKDSFITAKGASKTENLLSDIRIEQENIGKKFYKVYKEARTELLRDIYKHNSYIKTDIDTGIEKAQKIIDRIVFAAFAEDRGLLPDNTLLRVIQAADSSVFGGSLWNTLKGFFEAIDRGSDKLEIPNGYNGGLFKHDEVLNNLQISDEPLRKVVELGSYNFAEDLSVNILGHIFEQSISDLEEIKNKVNESQSLEAISQSRRKKDGIFYTPDYIVRYIVDNSLGAYLREHEEKFKAEFGLKGDITDKTYEKRERQAYTKYQDFLQNIKVVDPACGSGAFLVYVFDYLLAENKRVGDILGMSLFSTDEYIRDILRNNIYGVDLNEESVEITKLSLWLKTAQKGKKLTSLDNNIKCGNSLVDDPRIAGAKAFSWHKEFADVFQLGGFDVVVGNPPYVRQELLGDQKPHLEKHYKVYAGTTDLFAYFYEKALDILKPDGLFSYISNTFAKTTGAGVVLRKYLKENAKIEQLIDFNTLTIFQGATTYPIILVFRKTAPAGAFKYLHVEKSDLIALDSALRNRAFNIKQATLNDLSWNFEESDSAELRQKINQYKTVREQYGKPYYGIKTGFNDAFIIDSKTRNRLIAEDASSEEIIKPFWEGKDISRWSSFVEDRFIIFTRRGININRYPAIKNYLEQYRINLTPRNDSSIKVGRKPGPYTWYEIQDVVAYYDLFEHTKITWTNLQNRGKFCFDESGKYINAPAVILPSEDKSLLGILNSKVVWFFLQGICVQRSGGYLEVKPQYFEQIPVPEKSEEWSKTMSLKVDEMLSVIKTKHIKNERFKNLLLSEFDIGRWPNKLNNWWTLDFANFVQALKLKLSLAQKDELLQVFEKYSVELASLDSKITATEREIDQLVYRLYGLTNEEVAIVEQR
ncbi:MAG TPA: DNA methyltransferase, partial [Patescibacteria group bacterium]|nr:DNA methyltransferase [Patescibacteria group bacterium]